MGNGIKFAGANRAYGPPEGVSEDQCKTLHVFTNGACIVSCWEFTDAELAEILHTRRAFLSVWSGSVLFPVFVGSESVTRELVADSGAVWKQEPPAPVQTAKVERHPGPWIGPDAELARACAMAAIQDYGDDDPETHQRIMTDGVWNDHVAVQAALAAIHHLRKTTP